MLFHRRSPPPLKGYLDTINISWADTELGRGPTGTAIRTREIVVAQNLHTDPRFAPWREQAERRGYASFIAMPLIAEGKVLGSLNIYSSEARAFDAEEIALLTELANELSFGLHIQNVRHEHESIEQERKVNYEQTQDALMHTVEAIAMMLEKRDPYTAGHQRRVAALSVAIARDLGMNADNSS